MRSTPIQSRLRAKSSEWPTLAGAGAICLLAIVPAAAGIPGGTPVGSEGQAAPGPTAGSPAASAPIEGAMPFHIPPMLFGRITDLSSSSFRIFAPGAAWSAGGPMQVTLPTYAKLYRIARINPAGLHHGDSVLVQGKSGDDGSSFSAVRLIRSSKLIPLAPGVALADSAPAATTDSAMPDGTAGGSDAAPAAGAAPGEKAPTVVQQTAQPNTQPAAQPVVKQVLKRIVWRGALPGEVVSADPLVVEIYDGSLWRVSLDDGAAVLDQQPIQPADLRANYRDGTIARVTGSETGPGAYRVAELDLLAPDITPQDLGAPVPRRFGPAVRPARRTGRTGIGNTPVQK